MDILRLLLCAGRDDAEGDTRPFRDADVDLVSIRHYSGNSFSQPLQQCHASFSSLLNYDSAPTCCLLSVLAHGGYDR